MAADAAEPMLSDLPWGNVSGHAEGARAVGAERHGPTADQLNRGAKAPRDHDVVHQGALSFVELRFACDGHVGDDDLGVDLCQHVLSRVVGRLDVGCASVTSEGKCHSESLNFHSV